MPGVKEQHLYFNSIRDKVSGGETGAGKFQQEVLLCQSQKGADHRRADGNGTNVLSWLNQLSGMPYGTVVGIGVETSEITEEIGNCGIQFHRK